MKKKIVEINFKEIKVGDKVNYRYYWYAYGWRRTWKTSDGIVLQKYMGGVRIKKIAPYGGKSRVERNIIKENILKVYK